MKVWLPAVIILLLGGAGIVVAYLYQQERIDSLTATNTSLKKDVNTLKKNSTAPNDTESGGTTQPDSTTYTSEKGVKIIVSKPTSNDTISSPVTVTGKVPGSWSFEAQFSVRLIDATGVRMAEAPATLQGDWMTDQLVPFTSTLKFDTTATKAGTIVLLKANPSDLPENNDTLVIPIRFK